MFHTTHSENWFTLQTHVPEHAQYVDTYRMAPEYVPAKCMTSVLGFFFFFWGGGGGYFLFQIVNQQVHGVFTCPNTSYFIKQSHKPLISSLTRLQINVFCVRHISLINSFLSKVKVLKCKILWSIVRSLITTRTKFQNYTISPYQLLYLHI